MKVLMFGWEFPPHISGGLGTACAGLTRALEDDDVEVLFVVPRLQGDEGSQHARLINASTIPVIRHSKFDHNSITDDTDKVVATSDSGHVAQDGPSEEVRTTIRFSPSLNPYTMTSTTQDLAGIREWNYSFEKKTEWSSQIDVSSTAFEGAGAQRRPRINQLQPYNFKGGYGATLMEEVARYADVAAEIARTYSFDAIHAHDWMTFPAGIAASRVSGKPLIVHVHATEIDRSGSAVNRAVFEIERQGMRVADKVVTVSQWTKQIAVQHYGADEGKIEIVHNGITPKKDIQKQAVRAPFGSAMVTFLGRITYQKGPMYFVEAARKVHIKFPDVHFIVAGAGDMLPEMIERIAQLRLSKHFHFTGFLDAEDVNTIWAMSSVYVMPSVSEPFGIAPLEAIQSGVPVIISHQTGVSEVMPHAIKVDFWNSEALAEAICSVLRFKSLANTLRKNSAEELKEITWTKAALKLKRIYDDLIAKHEESKKPLTLLPGSPALKTEQAALL